MDVTGPIIYLTFQIGFKKSMSNPLLLRSKHGLSQGPSFICGRVNYKNKRTIFSILFV